MRRTMTSRRMALRKVVGAVALAATMVMGSAAGSHAHAQQMKKITIGTSYPGIETMAVYVARAQGYFDAEQISVDLVSLATGDKIAFALLSGSIDIARYTPDWIVRAIEKGGDLKIILGSNTSLVFSLITRKEINSYADLKGKRIGVSAIRAADAHLTEKMFAANGLKPSDYVMIQAGSSPDRAAALRAGSLSATLLSPPTDQRVLDSSEFKRLDLSRNVVPRYAWGGEAVRVDWAKANKPTLLAYMRAWIRASRWMQDPANKEGVIAILAKEGKMEEHYARAMYDLYFVGANAVPLKDGEPDMVGYDALLKDLSGLGQIASPPPPPSKYVDVSYWEEAMKSFR